MVRRPRTRKHHRTSRREVHRTRLESLVVNTTALVVLVTLVCVVLLTLRHVLLLWGAVAILVPVTVIGLGALIAVDSERDDPRQALGTYLRAVQWVLPAEAMLVVGTVVRLRVPSAAGSLSFYQAGAQIIPLLLIAAVLQEGSIDLRGMPASAQVWSRGFKATWLGRSVSSSPSENVRYKNEFADAIAQAQGLLTAFCVIAFLLVGEGAALQVLFTEQPKDNAGAIVAGALAAGLAGVLVRVIAKPWDRPRPAVAESEAAAPTRESHAPPPSRSVPARTHKSRRKGR